ncbi:MAG: hypothetical protein IKE28_02300 [Solobacterium sp.]|nr:hypothetical protein [Solobacterium sp.]
MTPYNDIFRLKQQGMNNSQIEHALGTVSRKTIITTLKLAEEKGFVFNADAAMSDTEIHRILHRKKDHDQRAFDIEKVMFELSLPNSTVTSVWNNYKENNKSGYSKSMFQLLIRENREKYTLPAYQSCVDIKYIKNGFSFRNGKKISVLFAKDRHSGKVFFTTAQSDEKTRTWIHALIGLMHQIGALPDCINFVGQLSKKYKAETEDCAGYYGMSVTETPVSKTDAFIQIVNSAMKEIGDISDDSQIWALRLALKEYNTQPLFSGRFNHEDAFECEKQAVLRKLPETDYDLVEYVPVSVQSNRHIRVDGCYYSVPFEYRHEKLMAFLSDEYIQISYLNTVLCTHRRLKPGTGKYSTLPEHVVSDDAVPFGEISGKSLRLWAAKIGSNTLQAIDWLLQKKTYEVQAYKVCETLLHYSTKYTPALLEEACQKAIETNNVTYQFITDYCKNKAFKIFS